MFKTLMCTVLAVAALNLAGCGGNENPPTEKVSGVVKMDGSAVEGATVTFLPDDSANRPAVGITDAEGRYSLTSFNSGDGAMAGSYKVTVSKVETEGGPSPYDPPPDANNKPMTLEEQYAAFDQGYSPADAAAPRGAAARQPGKRTFLVPQKYEETATSGLSFTVAAGDNTYDIELLSKPGK